MNKALEEAKKKQPLEKHHLARRLLVFGGTEKLWQNKTTVIKRLPLWN